MCSFAKSGEARVSDLRIYGIARTRAFRALWVANEVGLEYEHLPIEIGDAGAGAPEFRATNPNGPLPFIEDKGILRFESLAIRPDLATNPPNGPPLPPTA